MSSTLLTQLSELAHTSEVCDYSAKGFHHIHDVQLERLAELASAFLSAGYVLEMMTCQDQREDSQVMRLCFTFNSFGTLDRHLVHASVAATGEAADAFEAPTLSKIYGSANWFEREVYDMYGVIFSEHPELERLLLPEDADFFPLRKDFGRIEDAETSDE